MGRTSWKPWANIPWAYKSIGQKTHTVLSACIAVFCFIYIGYVGISSYLDTDISEPTHAVAVLLDTSLSMSAADVKPNRYAHALAITSGVIAKYPAKYVTIPFNGLPMIRTPWSTDSTGIQQVLTQYSLGSYQTSAASMGSAPGNAIGLAREYLTTTNSSKKSILLLGDGSTNTGYTIDAFLPYLIQDNIQVFICALGEEKTVLGRNAADSDVVSYIDTQRLDRITQKTDGQRRYCNNKEDAIYNLVRSLQGDDIMTSPHTRMEAMRAKTHLHTIAIIAILYTIISAMRSLLWYILYTEKRT